MRKSAYLSLVIALVTLAFISVTYSACKKDKCKKVSCLNGGTCKDGNCACPTGYAGNTCESETRATYYKTYKGDGLDTDGETYPANKLKFYKNGDNVNSMKVDLFDQNDNAVNMFELTLTSNTSFDIVQKVDDGVTYTGSGTISTTAATLKIKITNGSSVLEINFTNMTAQ